MKRTLLFLPVFISGALCGMKFSERESNQVISAPTLTPLADRAPAALETNEPMKEDLREGMTPEEISYLNEPQNILARVPSHLIRQEAMEREFLSRQKVDGQYPELPRTIDDRHFEPWARYLQSQAGQSQKRGAFHVGEFRYQIGRELILATIVVRHKDWPEGDRSDFCSYTYLVLEDSEGNAKEFSASCGMMSFRRKADSLFFDFDVESGSDKFWGGRVLVEVPVQRSRNQAVIRLYDSKFSDVGVFWRALTLSQGYELASEITKKTGVHHITPPIDASE